MSSQSGNTSLTASAACAPLLPGYSQAQQDSRMAGITINLPFDAIDATVAAALAGLMKALGAPVRAPSTTSGGRAAPALPDPKVVRIPRSGATAPEPALAPDAGWVEFVGGLSSGTKAFLALLEARGRLSMAEALSELGLDGGKALGGLTGALRRTAKRAGVELPFRALMEDGERVWVVTDGAATATVSPAQATAPRPRSASFTSTSWREFRASLSPDTNKFIDLIIKRERLTLAAAMKALKKDSGKGIGGVAGALQRKANNRGITLPFTAATSRSGGRVWVLNPAVLRGLEGQA